MLTTKADHNGIRILQAETDQSSGGSPGEPKAPTPPRYSAT